jgi:hypothetical protein
MVGKARQLSGGPSSTRSATDLHGREQVLAYGNDRLTIFGNMRALLVFVALWRSQQWKASRSVVFPLRN